MFPAEEGGSLGSRQCSPSEMADSGVCFVVMGTLRGVRALGEVGWVLVQGGRTGRVKK